MKTQIVLISHGDFAKELLRSAEMIVGPVEGARALSMAADDGKDGLLRKLNAVLDELGAGCPLIIAVDILSGTPCNVAVEKMIERADTAVVAGLNLGMILEYWGAPDEDADALAGRIASASREIVVKLEKPSLGNSEEGYED